MLQEIAILLPQFVDLTGTIPYIKWIILAKQVIFVLIRPEGMGGVAYFLFMNFKSSYLSSLVVEMFQNLKQHFLLKSHAESKTIII